MTQDKKTILKKRLMSFLWRLGGFALVAILNFILEQLTIFELPPSVIMVLALIVGEITKFVNVNLPELRKNIAPEPPTQVEILD